MSLKEEIDQFGELFKRRLSDNSKATLRWVECESVDWDEKTMTALGDDDLKFFDVLLGVGTVAIKPMKGTDCLIAIVEGDESTAFMLYADQAEIIEYNNGENGGIAIVGKVHNNLDQIKNYVEAMNTAVSTGLNSVGEGSAASGSAAKSAYELAMIGQSIDLEAMENEKIKH